MSTPLVQAVGGNDGKALVDYPEEHEVRPVRVCFLIDRLDRAGTEMQLLALIRNLDRSRVEPYLVLLDGEEDTSRSLEPADCPILRLGVTRLLEPRTAERLLRFRRFLRNERIDVLHLYFLDSTYFGALAGRLSGVQCIVGTHNNSGHWIKSRNRLEWRVVNRLVDWTVCNNEASRQSLIAARRSSPNSIYLIENGVDLDRFAHIPPPNALEKPNRCRRIGMIANLRDVKGIDILIHAAVILGKRHPDVTFHVVGEGLLRPKLQQMIGELDLDGRFFLPGTTTQIPDFLATLDVAVLSSRAEGMPNAILEYMASARPIVATDVGGVRSMIDDGVQGLIVRAEDPRQLAEACSLLLDDPDLCSRLGTFARQRVQEQFSRQAMANRFQIFYHTITGARTRG